MKARAPSPEVSAIRARHPSTMLRALVRPFSRSSASAASVGTFSIAWSRRFLIDYSWSKAASISRSFIASLQPEIGTPQRFVIGHFRNRAGKADASTLQHKYPRRHFEETDILLGDQEREPPPAQIAEDADDFLDKQRR